LLCYDINPEAIKLTESLLDFEKDYLKSINDFLKELDIEKNKW